MPKTIPREEARKLGPLTDDRVYPLQNAPEAPPRASNDPAGTSAPPNPKLPLLTLSGESVRLITDQGRTAPWVGYVGDSKVLEFWHRDGKHVSGDPERTLVNKVYDVSHLYANLYETESGYLFTGTGHLGRRAAELGWEGVGGNTRIGVVKIDISQFIGKFWEEDL